MRTFNSVVFIARVSTFALTCLLGRRWYYKAPLFFSSLSPFSCMLYFHPLCPWWCTRWWKRLEYSSWVRVGIDHHVSFLEASAQELRLAKMSTPGFRALSELCASRYYTAAFWMWRPSILLVVCWTRESLRGFLAEFAKFGIFFANSVLYFCKCIRTLPIRGLRESIIHRMCITTAAGPALHTKYISNATLCRQGTVAWAKVSPSDELVAESTQTLWCV